MFFRPKYKQFSTVEPMVDPYVLPSQSLEPVELGV